MVNVREIRLDSLPGRAGIGSAIDELKSWNRRRAEVISHFEDYQRAVLGCTVPDETHTGFRYGYEAEIRYLRERIASLRQLIHAVENYAEGSTNLTLEL
jgi:hypothetical protein